jgi:hypothetical protein
MIWFTKQNTERNIITADTANTEITNANCIVDFAVIDSLIVQNNNTIGRCLREID